MSLPMKRAFEVLAAGPLSTVQDLGRPGWAHLGVPRSGAADLGSLRLANRLVGNLEAAGGLEITLGGLVARAHADLTIAVTGADAPLTLDGVPHPARAVLAWPAGAELRLGTASAGLRAYLAVHGGLDLPAVLGSRSSDQLGGIGPAPLAAGDLVPVGAVDGPMVTGWPDVDVAPGAPPASGRVTLSAVPGPRDDLLTLGPAALAGPTWRVSPDSDRVGLRLTGDPVATRAGASVPSAPLVRGAVQVPPGGEPVIFLADHPVTGGYPVVAVLLEDDVDRAAQLRPGQAVRLRIAARPDGLDRA